MFFIPSMKQLFMLLTLHLGKGGAAFLAMQSPCEGNKSRDILLINITYIILIFLS